MENEDAQDHTDHTKRLPRDLLLAILGSLPARAAVKASLLIPDWRSLWTEVPVLNLNSTLFGTFQAFENFVIGVFTHRNNELKLEKISYLSSV
ncbi:F-box/LRR-repeat protein 13 [Linum perenne]